jgi:hypothetical protein
MTKGALRRLKSNVDATDIWFASVALAGYAAFVSWADLIVRAVRGEKAEESWRTLSSSAGLIALWTLTTGAKVREFGSLREAAVEMRNLAYDTAAQDSVRDQRAAERDLKEARQQARLLSLTKWLVALAAVTLAAALVTLGAALAS